MLDMALIEPRALLGQCVDIGCGGQWVAVAAYAFGSQFVWLEKDKVHLVFSWICNCSDLLRDFRHREEGTLIREEFFGHGYGRTRIRITDGRQ